MKTTKINFKKLHETLVRAKALRKSLVSEIKEIEGLWFENQEEIIAAAELLKWMGTSGLGIDISIQEEDYWAPLRIWIYIQTPKKEKKIPFELHARQGLKQLGSNYRISKGEWPPYEEGMYYTKIIKRVLNILLAAK